MNMKLTINGKPAVIEGKEALNLPEVLDALKVEQPDYVTVELNGEVLERENFTATTVRDGDSLEFLYFMGGGH
jgi:sulfur carrier protein